MFLNFSQTYKRAVNDGLISLGSGCQWAGTQQGLVHFESDLSSACTCKCGKLSYSVFASLVDCVSIR